MIKMKPKIEKGSEDRGTGIFHHRHAKLRNFIRKKEKPVRRCKYINNDIFDLVFQGQTKLFANSFKRFYYICGIKFQRNRSKVQYSVKNISKPKMYAPTEPVFKEGKTAITMDQKGILDAKIK